MTIQELIAAQSQRLDDEMRRDIIEIRRELPELGYELSTIYQEGRHGLLFSACYELSQPHPDKQQAVATIRVSRYLQSDNHSLLTQATQIIALAQERGQTIARFYIDAGFSGADSKRPSFQAMIRCATQQVHGSPIYCAVYSYDLYRFYRGLQGLATHYRILYDSGVELVSVADKHTDLGSRDGKLLTYIKGIMGELYLDDLSRTVRDNKRSRALKGYSNASSAPFGYCRGNCFQCTDGNGAGYCPRWGNRVDLWREMGDDPNVFVPHPVDQHAFRLMNELHTTGRFSDGDIVQRLNPPENPDECARLLNGPRIKLKEVEEGVVVVLLNDVFAFEHLNGDPQFFRPKGQPGRAAGNRRFNKDTIRDILQNPYYAGFVVYRPQKTVHGRREQAHKRFKSALTEHLSHQRAESPIAGDVGMLIPGQHIPLITLDAYDQSQQVRGLRGFNPGHAGLERRLYPLSGVIRCRRCERPFRGNAANGDVRYYEDAGRATGASHCPVRAFRAECVEETVFTHVQQLRIPEEWDAAVLSYLREGAEWDTLRRERRAVETHLSSIREMLEQKIITLGEFRERERGLRRQLERLEQETQAADARYTGLLRDFPRIWAAATDEERKGLLRCIFHAIWVEDGVVVAYEPRAPFAALLPPSLSLTGDHVEQLADRPAQPPTP